MRSRQLYASITATGAGSVYFDVPDDTTIRGIAFTATVGSGNLSDYLNVEVSLSSSNQTAVSDAQGIIGVFSTNVSGGGTPASATATALVGYCPAACPVKKGTRVYLNYTESGSGTWLVRALVWFD